MKHVEEIKKNELIDAKDLYDSYGVKFYYDPDKCAYVIVDGYRKLLTIPKDLLKNVLDNLPDIAHTHDVQKLCAKFGKPISLKSAQRLIKVLAHPVFGLRELIKRHGKLLLVREEHYVYEYLKRELKVRRELLKDFDFTD